MPLIYSAVARGPVVLAEYAVFAGNFSSVAKAYLSKSTNDGRFAYTVDNHVFSFLAEDNYCECEAEEEPQMTDNLMVNGACPTQPASWLAHVPIKTYIYRACRLRGGD